jgi:hypothetical protein
VTVGEQQENLPSLMNSTMFPSGCRETFSNDAAAVTAEPHLVLKISNSSVRRVCRAVAKSGLPAMFGCDVFLCFLFCCQKSGEKSGVGSEPEVNRHFGARAGFVLVVK